MPFIINLQDSQAVKGNNAAAIADIKTFAESDFVLSSSKVQGALTGKAEKNGRQFTFVDSPKRFKISAGATDIIKIVSGGGFFKWKKGETKFISDGLYLLQNTGEYELSGKCRFILFKSEDLIYV